MSAPASRRGFLRGLTTLPLIGGGVALLGNPSAVAEAATPACLDSYLAFLHYEFRAVHEHRWPGSSARMVPMDNPGALFHVGPSYRDGDWHGICRESAARAPLVLSTVGCDWRGGGHG